MRRVRRLRDSMLGAGTRFVVFFGLHFLIGYGIAEHRGTGGDESCECSAYPGWGGLVYRSDWWR
jgi:hypothetical protein